MSSKQSKNTYIDLPNEAKIIIENRAEVVAQRFLGNMSIILSTGQKMILKTSLKNLIKQYESDLFWKHAKNEELLLKLQNTIKRYESNR